MRISAIIPTHNRQDSLAKTLDHLVAQDCSPSDYEIIVVDDGSEDGTWPWLQAQVDRYPFPLRPVRQPRQGPAAARNQGLEAARGDLVLFLGDDIYASPSLVSCHLAAHATWPDRWIAVLGPVQWAPGLPVSSLMRWMETGGAQWYFEGLEEGANLDYGYFITANLSIRRDLLLEFDGFDTGFKNAVLEDTELGYRLGQKGLQIRYLPGALAYHWHPVKLDAFLARSRLRGEAAVHLVTRWPELRQKFMDPGTWFGDRHPATIWLLSHAIRWRPFVALLHSLGKRMADRPPGLLQRWASPMYWLLVYHHQLLGIGSVTAVKHMEA